MKIIYTILFFAGVLLLVILSFRFLKLLDTGVSGVTLALMLMGIALCIVLLVYFLYKYVMLPPNNSKR